MKKPLYILLISSATITSVHAQINLELVKALSGVFPQQVTAHEIGLTTICINDITKTQHTNFDQHLRIVVVSAAELLQEWWDTIKDLVSENSRGSNITYYTKILEQMHIKLNKIIQTNDCYSKTKPHPAHQQMITLVQGLLSDLSDIINITKSVLANKKLYRSKATKRPCAAKLGTKLQDRLAKYTKKKDSYLKKLGYLWDFALSAGHVGTIDPLAQAVCAVHKDYQNNKKLFSAEFMIVALQHKLKKK